MVKDPLGEWVRVYTFCALLVDLAQVLGCQKKLAINLIGN